jgi:hypothetical protein
LEAAKVNIDRRRYGLDWLRCLDGRTNRRSLGGAALASRLDDVALGVNLLAPTLLRQLRIDGARKRRLALFRSNPCADTRPDGESRWRRASSTLYRGCLRGNLRRAHSVDALDEGRQHRAARDCDQGGRDHPLDIDLRCSSRRNAAAARPDTRRLRGKSRIENAPLPP